MAKGDGPSASHEEAAERVVALRGALWRGHAELSEIEPADDGYPDAVTELIELTAELLAAEAVTATLASSPLQRAADAVHRHISLLARRSARDNPTPSGQDPAAPRVDPMPAAEPSTDPLSMLGTTRS